MKKTIQKQQGETERRYRHRRQTGWINSANKNLEQLNMEFLSFVCVISEKLLTVLSIHNECVCVCERSGKSFVSLYNSS